MLNKPEFLEHIKHSVDFSILDVKWIQGTANLCVSGADKCSGIIQCLQMNSDSRQLRLMNTIHRSKPIRCISFGLDSKRQVVAGDISGRLQIM